MTDTDHGLLTIDHVDQDVSGVESIPVTHTELGVRFLTTPDDDGILRTVDGKSFASGPYQIADFDAQELEKWG